MSTERLAPSKRSPSVLVSGPILLYNAIGKIQELMHKCSASRSQMLALPEILPHAPLNCFTANHHVLSQSTTSFNILMMSRQCNLGSLYLLALVTRGLPRVDQLTLDLQDA